MSTPSTGPVDDSSGKPMSLWALFNARHLAASLMLGGGVALYAVETYITATVMPSVVRDIGGLYLFAWTTTLYVASAILGSIFIVIRPRGMTLKQCYLAGAAGFGLGSLICGVAPTMEIVLAGRIVQGGGAGLLASIAYAFIRHVYPEPLWGKASTLYAAIWGISTLLGPTVGGLFSEGSDWRDAFYVLIPFSIAMMISAARLLPASADDRSENGAPLAQILLLIGAVLLVSIAGSADDTYWRSLAITAAIIAIVLMIVIERRAKDRILPRGAVSLKTPISKVYATMVLLLCAMTCDIFIPYFLQVLHGVPPLVSGYLVALVATGWTLAAFVTTNLTGRAMNVAISAGAAVETVAILGLAFLLARDNPDASLLILGPAVVCMLGIGFGVGVGWAHLVSYILVLADDDEKDKASAGITTMQSLGTAFGAAISGVIVNSTGLLTPGGVAGSLSAAAWLFGLMAIPAAIALVSTLALMRDRAVGKAAA